MCRFQLAFVNTATNEVEHAINNVGIITYIVPGEVGYSIQDGLGHSKIFSENQHLEVRRMEK